MKRKRVKEISVDDFVGVLEEQLVCLNFETGVPICILHRQKRGVYVKTKYKGGVFFVIDPAKNKYYFKLFDPEKQKIRWSCEVVEVDSFKLANDNFVIINDLYALSFDDIRYKYKTYLKFISDVFKEDFDPNTIQFYRKEKSKSTPKSKAKSTPKKKVRKREPFTPGPETPKKTDPEGDGKKKKKKKKEECVALFDYKAKTPLELSVKEGDVLKIHGINQEEGFIVGEIINPSDMSISPKAKRRTPKGKRNIQKGKIPEHYTNHLLDEYKKKVAEKDQLEIAIKKWEKYRTLQEKRLKKREEEIAVREGNIEQDRKEAMRKIKLTKQKYDEENRTWLEEKRKDVGDKRKEMENFMKGRREELIKFEKAKKKDLLVREKKLQNNEERNSSQNKRLMEKEQHVKELTSRVARRTKRIKQREKTLNEKEALVNVADLRNKERSHELQKMEVRLVKREKILNRKDRELKRFEGVLNKKKYALNPEDLPSSAKKKKKKNGKKSKNGDLELEEHKKLIESNTESLENEKKKTKNGIDDTVFLDLLKKQQEVDHLTNLVNELKRKIYSLEKKDLDNEEEKIVEEEEGKEKEKEEIEKLKLKIRELEEKSEQTKSKREEELEELRKKKKEDSEKRKSEIDLLKQQILKIQQNDQNEVENLRNQIILHKDKYERNIEENKKYKSVIKKLKSEKKKLLLENLKYQGSDDNNKEKKIIEEEEEEEEEEDDVMDKKFTNLEVQKMRTEIKTLCGDIRSQQVQEQLWFQRKFAKHTNSTRKRLNELAEQIKQRASDLEKKDSDISKRGLEFSDLKIDLEDLRQKLQRKEKELERREGKAPPPSMEDISLSVQENVMDDQKKQLEGREKKLDKKQQMLKDWEEELKTRENDLSEREKTFHEQRMKDLQDKKSVVSLPPPLLKDELFNSSESEENDGESPRRVHQIRLGGNNRKRRRSQESPGRIENIIRDDPNLENVRPRKMSRESPGRLETSPKSDKKDPTNIPSHLKEEFENKNSNGRFDFILGRYEHRIKFAKRLRSKSQSFEELKKERLEGKDFFSTPIKKKKGKSGKFSIPSPLPSPLNEEVVLKKLMETRPPVPSKTKRLKTDELADVIFSPKMRSDQLKLFDNFSVDKKEDDDKKE